MGNKIVAIVGRPNVGKSTFFNMLIGEKLSIVSDTPGVTRDRVTAKCTWRDAIFELVDTGGIEELTDDVINQAMRRQTVLAMDMADVIIFLTDIKQGVTAMDLEIANMLRRTHKPVILVCNKADSVGKDPDELYEFYNLGLGTPYAVSAMAKLGIGDVLDAVYDATGDLHVASPEEDRISVAIIGKPNVGKSSLVNKILREDRVIVSNVAGTTRDAIDENVDNEYGKYTLIDTAGIRKKNKIYDDIEKYSIIKAKIAIDRSNVVLIVIDANEGVTDQDEKIAGIAYEKGKAMIIVVNKWDEYMKKHPDMTPTKYAKIVRQSFKFILYAPIITLSALTGLRVNNLFEYVNKVYAANNLRITTSMLNDVVIESMALHPAPTFKGKRLKIYYATQVKSAPPTFVLFVNDKELAHFSYLRYLENELRNRFDLEGTPINILAREKGEKVDD